jgi:toxin HigB-1
MSRSVPAHSRVEEPYFRRLVRLLRPHPEEHCIVREWEEELRLAPRIDEGTRPFPANIERVALRKLTQLSAAEKLGDLRVPPGNRLEALRGNRTSQHSIRINDQWRICFVWKDG